MRVPVDAMLGGAVSIGYVGLLTTSVCYVFAIVGVDTFKANDPFNFGSLHRAMLTLFRCATLENWTEVMCT